MQSIKRPLCLIISSSMLLGSLSVFAADPIQSPSDPAPKTPHSYNQNGGNFCQGGADTFMRDLNAANQDKMDRLEEIRDLIAEKTNFGNVIQGMLAAKQDYLEGLEGLSHSGNSRETKRIRADMDHLKAAIRAGLTLSAVKLLMEEKAPNASTPFSMREICKDPKNARLAVCATNPSLVPLRDGSFVHSQSLFGGHVLDNTLANFKEAFIGAGPSNQEELRSRVNKILSDIPKALDPDVILNVLQERAPIPTLILQGSLKKETIMKCIGDARGPDADSACQEIISDPQKRDELISAMRTQMIAVSEELGENKYATVINSALNQSIENINNDMNAYAQKMESSQHVANSLASAMVSSARELTSPNRRDSQARYHARSNTRNPTEKNQWTGNPTEPPKGMAYFFYEEPSNSDPTPDELASASERASATARDWKARCERNIQANDREYCRNITNKITPRIETIKSDFQQYVSGLQADMRKIQDDDFNNIELLKKYVAEKFLRTCGGPGASIKDESFGMNFRLQLDDVNGPNCISAHQQASKIIGLSSDVADVISKTTFYKRISPQSASESTFTGAELSEFNRVCSNTELKTKYPGICKTIASETKETKAIVTADKLERLNEDSWVVYNDSGTGGYRRVYKKSKLRIFGEGVLPVVPSLIPAWFGNYQMKQNINSLTQQALFQKQMLHTQDIYNSSPWMYDYNYFQATNFGAPAGSTMSTGFNFGFGQ